MLCDLFSFFAEGGGGGGVGFGESTDLDGGVESVSGEARVWHSFFAEGGGGGGGTPPAGEGDNWSEDGERGEGRLEGIHEDLGGFT